MIEEVDHDALLEFFETRLRHAADAAAEAYWSGRIDGHCMQNGIALDELTELADEGGYTIDWISALEGFDF